MKDERVSPEVSSGDRVLLGPDVNLEEMRTPYLNNGGRGRDQWPGRKLPPANIAPQPPMFGLGGKKGVFWGVPPGGGPPPPGTPPGGSQTFAGYFVH